MTRFRDEIQEDMRRGVDHRLVDGFGPDPYAYMWRAVYVIVAMLVLGGLAELVA